MTMKQAIAQLLQKWATIVNYLFDAKIKNYKQAALSLLIAIIIFALLILFFPKQEFVSNKF